MARKILINGRREEELRVAIVENQTLEDFEIETKRSGLLRNNIYRGVVTNIAPSLNAAFVDFGESRNGFLAFNDVVESVYAKPVKDAHKISDVLVPGQTLIVQVIKDAGGLKGAQVTTNVSLAGRYLVLRPKDSKSGVSRKVDDDARADLTQKVRSLDLPDGYGCIVRTNAMDQSRAVLLRDAKVLVQLWHKIETEYAKGTAPQLLYNDQDIVVQAMRDYFDSSIHEVLIDNKSCYERAKAYIRATVESGENKIKYYDDKMPIFTRYGIERQIEQIYARTVALPSGGFIVIDPTEALTAIDVNSAHSTKRESQDLTAYHTNLEAAVEIGRQLRMRDIGGLIVIDFIDMRSGKHQRDVERVMRNAMARDKARNKVERISPNGLLEINRQRISQALSQRTHLQCPTCGGRGFIPSAEAMGLNLIREIDARAVNGELGGVIIKLHPDIAQQLQNERRREFAQLEHEYGIRIEIVATREISRGEDAIEWLTRRQENALHPERTQQNSDAASIIDVAEAYEAHDSDEDVYRPNDYEEFSSEEARKKRAAKRAARRENKDIETVETERQEEIVSKREKREKRDADKREDVAKTDKTQVASKADGKPEKMHAISRAASSMAMLGILVEQMRHRLEDDQPRQERGRRHLSFKARSRKGETKSKKDSGIRMDLRMFALDILKAVCVIACDCESNVSRREMISMVPAASDWLIESIQVSKDELLKRVALLRTQITSRHASARLTCLFDENHGLTPDTLGRTLIEDRDAAIGRRNIQDEGVLEALEMRIASRCARIFGDGKAPASFDTSEIELSLDQLEEDDIQSMLEVSSMNDIVNAIEEQTSAASSIDEDEDKSNRRHRSRRSRRRSMEETPVSPYVGENCEIITSNVPIAPMILMEDEDTAESEAESALSIAQAITQELPAVSSDRRNRRQRRRDHEIREENKESTNVAESVENIVAESSVKTPVVPAAGEMTTSGRRRERSHKRRAFGADESLSAENMKSVETDKIVDSVASPETVKPEHPEHAETEDKPMVQTEKHSERRERRSKRDRLERNASHVETKHAETSKPQIETETKPADTAEAENRSIRRVRKTRVYQVNLADYDTEALAETPAAPEAAVLAIKTVESVDAEPAVIESAIEPAVIEPAVTTEDIANTSQERRERRTRRTRRGALDAVVDSSTVDSAVVDSAAVDSAVVDSAVVDSAVVDSAVVDSVVVDSAVVDSAVVDSAVVDSVVANEAEEKAERRERRARRSTRRQFGSEGDIPEQVTESVTVSSEVPDTEKTESAQVSDDIQSEAQANNNASVQETSPVSKRRVRKTREAAKISEPEHASEIANISISEPSDSEPVTTEKRRVRKTRSSRRTDALDETVKPAESVTAPTAEEAAISESVVTEEKASVEKRRVRKTRPRQVSEADANLTQAEVHVEETASTVSSETEAAPSEKRRVRRTRKTANPEGVQAELKFTESETSLDDTTEPVRTRSRRTRRTKLEE